MLWTPKWKKKEDKKKEDKKKKKKKKKKKNKKEKKNKKKKKEKKKKKKKKKKNTTNKQKNLKRAFWGWEGRGHVSALPPGHASSVGASAPVLHDQGPAQPQVEISCATDWRDQGLRNDGI